jgi:DNA-directed RNA polymerase specialized sigma subunit
MLVGYERDEIISYATLGLVAAALRWEDYCRENDYEPYKGEAGSWFDTYASRRINGSIIDALRSSDPATRRERALIKQIIAAGVDLSSPWEHESAESIAAKAQMPVEDVRRAVSALVRMPVSLEETTEDCWPADPVDVSEDALESGLCGKVVAVIQRLPQIHQLVIALAYYLDLSDEEIVQRMPEIRADPDMGRHSLAWVACLREQGASLITEVVRKELVSERSNRSLAG